MVHTPPPKVLEVGVPTKETAVSWFSASPLEMSAVGPPVPRITLPVVLVARTTLSVSATAVGDRSVMVMLTVVQAERDVPSKARYANVSTSGVTSEWSRAGAV